MGYYCSDCRDEMCRSRHYDLDLMEYEADQYFTFQELGEALEHLRSVHYSHILRRPAALGYCDSHGHMWYCFEHETLLKDHRSFDSHEAVFQHWNSCHVEVIVKNPY
jgi:hypothetical protein